MNPGVLVTMAEVCAAAGEIRMRTALRWVTWGLLPQPEKLSMGKHRAVTCWPKIAVAQARWVRQCFDSGMLREQVREALERGDFDRFVLGDRTRASPLEQPG